MANIFRQATCVLVWLGESEPSDTLAFAMLHASDAWLSEWGNQKINDYHDTMQAVLEKEPWCDCCKVLIGKDDRYVDSGYSAVDELTWRNWFARLWVYQEVACARAVDIHCGFHHHEWDSFRLFSNGKRSGMQPSDIDLLFICRDTIGYSFDPSAFLRLLVLLRDKLCEENQDRVYAIRSVARLEHLSSLQPDYAISSSELYSRVVIECLKDWRIACSDHRRLEKYPEFFGAPGLPLPHISLVLALATADTANENKKCQELRPSWVPAFHLLPNRALAKYHEYSWHLGIEFLMSTPPIGEEGRIWKSKAPLQSKIQIKLFPDAPNILATRGTRFGTVLEVLENSESPFAYEFDKTHYETWDVLLKDALSAWMSRCAKFANSYLDMDDKTLKELFYCNSLDSGFDADIHRTMMEPLRMFDQDLATSEKIVEDWILREFLEPVFEDSFMNLRYYDDFRQLAAIKSRDDKRYLGWIPQSAQPGDIVSVFYGCPRPFLIRQQNDGTFKLLGDTWILGVPDRISFDIPKQSMEWISLS